MEKRMRCDSDSHNVVSLQLLIVQLLQHIRNVKRSTDKQVRRHPIGFAKLDIRLALSQIIAPGMAQSLSTASIRTPETVCTDFTDLDEVVIAVCVDGPAKRELSSNLGHIEDCDQSRGSDIWHRWFERVSSWVEGVKHSEQIMDAPSLTASNPTSRPHQATQSSSLFLGQDGKCMIWIKSHQPLEFQLRAINIGDRVINCNIPHGLGEVESTPDTQVDSVAVHQESLP
ncbi:hypothetical protein J7T55_002204 [Diaporthe amygdali]|uniref:uncharacterized protein n=1 Tax=Phomopsis amygdali TaxID=1214568 RepID=UPI0022FE51FE|nr:uncharacterized protein J7T55_002204 [Diaporthe amygdali]KAJ0103785.1 hypothetical protein J7T55_002204 [Diaporthe amygdali]